MFRKICKSLVILMSVSCAWGAETEVVIRDGTNAWRFVAVDGTSQLPLQRMRTGQDRDRLETVTLPRYWIAVEPVTERQFAAVMDRAVRPGPAADRSAADLEWIEAQTFCDRFTDRFAAQLPEGTFATLPTMLEWAHAVRVLEGRADLCADTATFLFTGSPYGGFLHSACKGSAALRDASRANEALACTYAAVPKREKSARVGLRPVLVDMRRTMLDDHPVVIRGLIALQHGFFAEAQRYLGLALSCGRLSERDAVRAGRALEFARHTTVEDLEDWSGLVTLTAKFAASKGFETEPYASAWRTRGTGPSTNAACVAAYRKAGVYGGWLSVKDLPREICTKQVAKPETKVQVVVCDFSGDGRTDLVVERYGGVGSGGYWYDFYRREPDGTYVEAHALQTVGLCVLPRRGGGGCGFLTVDRCSNPVLAVRLLWYENGRFLDQSAHPKPFGMLDAKEDRVYLPAPFIGGGLGTGWRVLEERGIWYRPVFWPWKPGTVPKP